MKKGWIITGIAIVVLLVATAGIAFAVGRGSGSSARSPVSGQMVAAHEDMHASAAMQAMHGQMPAALRARCDALHERMDRMMGSMTAGSGMMTGGAEMTGPGMMTGGAGMAGGSMADHHPTTER